MYSNSTRKQILHRVLIVLFIATVTISLAQGKMIMTKCAIHNNKLWARLGDNRIFILGMDQRVEDAKIIDNNILDGEPVYRFFSTPYGLIGIGEGIVGLIEIEEK